MNLLIIIMFLILSIMYWIFLIKHYKINATKNDSINKNIKYYKISLILGVLSFLSGGYILFKVIYEYNNYITELSVMIFGAIFILSAIYYKLIFKSKIDTKDNKDKVSKSSFKIDANGIMIILYYINLIVYLFYIV